MRLKSFCQCLSVVACFLEANSLDHEKSFLYQDSASYVLAIGIYKDSLLITVSNDIVQKDIFTNSVQRTFRAHDKTVYDFVLTNDSRMISAGFDDMIIVWDLVTGSILKRIWVRTPDTRMSSIAVQNDIAFAGGLDNMVRQVDLVSGRVVRTIDLVGYVYSVEVGGEYFYIGKKVYPFILKYSIRNFNSKVIFEGHTNTVFTLYLSNDTLLSGSADTNVICWNVTTGDIIRILIGHTDLVQVVALFDGFVYSAGTDRHIIKWNLDNGQILKKFPIVHSIEIRCFAYKQSELFSGSLDAVVVKWDAATGDALGMYRSRNTKLRAVANWKNFVISAGEDIEIKFWDASIDSINPLGILFGHLRSINSLFVYEDFIFSGGSDTTVRQWDMIGFALEKIFEGPISAITSVATSQPSVYSSGYENIIYQWNISSGLLMGRLSGHTDYVEYVTLDASYLYSASRDQTIRLWNVQSQLITRTFESLTSLRVFIVTNEFIIAGTVDGLESFSLETGLRLVFKFEQIPCSCIVSAYDRAYSGHPDGVIRSRDFYTLNVLEEFQGHSDYVSSLSFDDSFNLFSAAFDGSIKKWNMLTRKVSFSFESRIGSVTALAANGNVLLIGTKGGDIFSYNIDNASSVNTLKHFNQSVSSLSSINGSFYATSLDGLLLKFSATFLNDVSKVYSSKPEPLRSLAFNSLYLIALKGETEAVLISRNGDARTTEFQQALVCLVATNSSIFAGSRSGVIYSWSIEDFELKEELKGHVAQVNSLLLVGENLFSGSDDKTIIEWSLKHRIRVKVYQRLSASALGHLGPVNALSYCFGALFSAGSDLSARRWNTITGKHEDVYLGYFKPVTTVLCHNFSVFAGSEDFSVLMFRPVFNDLSTIMSSSSQGITLTNGRKAVKVVQKVKASESSAGFSITFTLILLVAAFLLLVFATVYFRVRTRSSMNSTQVSTKLDNYTSTTFLDLHTVVNSVMGISKHAAYLIPSSMIAKVRKLTSGGGGDLYVVRLMDSNLHKKAGETAIQKVVFINNKSNEAAFFQEVGIMIMLSSSPHFCQIIGYTENPLSMILKFYPNGSLFEWLRKNHNGRVFAGKLLMELAEALETMHSHYLAHCDIKTQNVLMQVEKGVPSCYLTDFGITQILSDRIVASRLFNVMNLRGLSVQYASPEAFANFSSKAFGRTDFKKYDVYSFACVMYEVLTRKAPWEV